MKRLLESGHTLHRPLLRKIVGYLADFVKGAGLVRFRKYVKPILTFIRKCVGVAETELDRMLYSFGIASVVYDAEDYEGGTNAREHTVEFQDQDISRRDSTTSEEGSTPAPIESPKTMH